MKRATIVMLGALGLAACQTDAANNLPDISTPSGKPEVTIKNADVATVKTALVNRVLSHGWTVTSEFWQHSSDRKAGGLAPDRRAVRKPDEHRAE